MSGKTAVITGATSGIGAAYAWRFAKQGYDLVITGRRKDKIDDLAERIKAEYGVKVEIILAELSVSDEIDKLIAMIQFKNIEVLVNNAGFGMNSLYQDCDLMVMEQVVKVNVLAPMKLIHAVLPKMVARGKGTIINISSESVYLSIPKNSVYLGAKAFLKSFTEGLHLDLMNTGVKVQAVCPGFTHTDFHERMGMKKSKQRNKGLIHWMSPDEVVEISMRDLKKNKVVCIPGLRTKLMVNLLNLLPRNAYYKLAYNFSRKKLVKKP